MSTRYDVFYALVEHIGPDRAIHARELAAELDISTRELRTHISALRREQIGIAATPAEGIYIATHPSQLMHTAEVLTRRALHSLQLASVLTGKPLAELAGQLLLVEK
jgi:biotin operon repressor